MSAEHGRRVHPGYEIAPAEAKALLDHGRALLVDVRTQEEWDLVHVPGSVHIPLHELGTRADELEPVGREVLVLCHHGRRSLDGAMILRSVGDPALAGARSVAGGIEAWSTDADPRVPRYERGPGVLRLR